jgi:UDP-glucose/iron transport system permease protein
MSAVPPTPADLLLAAMLLVMNGVIAIMVGPRFARSLALAVMRMVVQLAAVGLVLRLVLAQTSPAWTALVALVMVLVAGFELRHDRRLGGWLAFGLGNATLMVVGGLATLSAAAVIVGPSPWYTPSYVLPILGMILGNTLTSISLALQALAEGAERERAAIEARIALGAPRFTAFAVVVRSALRTATTPLINTLAVAGVATLPGMMAGQILAGVDPAEAARYQIMIMLVLAAAASLGALAAALGGVLLMTDARHRLRLDRLVGPRTASENS